MDFTAAANEVANWVGRLTSADFVAFGKTASIWLGCIAGIVVGGTIAGHYGSRAWHKMANWYETNCDEPKRKPFQDIEKVKLPKSGPKF